MFRLVGGGGVRWEGLQDSLEEARQLFRDQERTEFVIVTIPTVMAMAESERLAASLQKEGVPVKRIVVNQMVCSADTLFARARGHLRAAIAVPEQGVRSDADPDAEGLLQQTFPGNRLSSSVFPPEDTGSCGLCNCGCGGRLAVTPCSLLASV